MTRLPSVIEWECEAGLDVMDKVGLVCRGF